MTVCMHIYRRSVIECNLQVGKINHRTEIRYCTLEKIEQMCSNRIALLETLLH